MAVKGSEKVAGSFFEDVESASEIEVFRLTELFKKDDFPKKVNLGVGAYRTDDGKPWVLGVVKTAEAQMTSDESLNHEYLPVLGLEAFRTKGQQLLLGIDSKAITENRVDSVQAVGGTGAIRLCAAFCNKQLGYTNMMVSDPTWGNHIGVFRDCGFTNIQKYRYWDAEKRGLNFDGMIEDIKAAPEKTVLILHGCCHNPTGINPTKDQWKIIADVVKEKRLLILLDEAYQGFATGDLEADGWPARFLQEQNLEFFVSQSFSKNFGLYNERVGNLVIVFADKTRKAQVMSQLQMIVRTTWSNPPNHGARIVATVLNNSSYMGEWKENVLTMSRRIRQMREELHMKLKSLGTPGDWSHIIKQTGMFSFTGLNANQVAFIVSTRHIYLLKNGRINMCALTTNNVDYVANAIDEAVRNVK